MKEFLKKELYSFRAVAAILARWLLLAVRSEEHTSELQSHA